jgi:ABC-type iron transport system FetAB ATPase subunit
LIQGDIVSELLSIQISRLFYKNKHLVSDINLKVNKGERILIVGATGTGKSSLLNALNLMNQSYHGEILLDGKPITDFPPHILRSRIVMVMQEPWLGEGTVSDVLAEPLQYHALKKRDLGQRNQKISKLFEAFQLSDSYLHQQADQLSGGEKQRVALIRALQLNPEILLLDEISSALDQKTSGIISDCIFNNFPGTVIAISHDPLWQNRWQRSWTIESGTLKDNREVK